MKELGKVKKQAVGRLATNRVENSHNSTGLISGHLE
jgi:hypothetical protein